MWRGAFGDRFHALSVQFSQAALHLFVDGNEVAKVAAPAKLTPGKIVIGAAPVYASANNTATPSSLLQVQYVGIHSGRRVLPVALLRHRDDYLPPVARTAIMNLRNELAPLAGAAMRSFVAIQDNVLSVCGDGIASVEPKNRAEAARVEAEMLGRISRLASEPIDDIVFRFYPNLDKPAWNGDNDNSRDNYTASFKEKMRQQARFAIAATRKLVIGSAVPVSFFGEIGASVDYLYESDFVHALRSYQYAMEIPHPSQLNGLLGLIPTWAEIGHKEKTKDLARQMKLEAF